MMPDYAQVSELYYSITNAAIALGMASIAITIAFSLYKKPTRYFWLSALLSAVFAVLSLSRFLKAFNPSHLPGLPEVMTDLMAAVLTLILASVMGWVVNKSLSMPSYKEIEKTNLELQYWEKLFETFMENSPAIAFLLDSNFNLIYINRAFEENFGVKREDMLGKPYLTHTTGENIQAIREHNETVQRENKSISRVLFISAKNKEPEPWLIIKFPVIGNNHNASIGGIGVNIADTHNAERTHAQLAAIVESSQDAIIGKDLNDKITSWNNGAEELYGYTAEEAIGQPISILVPPERLDEMPMLLDKLKRGLRVNHYDTLRLCKNGKIKNVSLSLSPIRADGKIIGAAIVARDITEQKFNEEQIIQLNRQLKERVYELAEQSAALQAARDAALEASNLKSAFCANISHELRTPLSGILGLNEMMLQNQNLSKEDVQLSTMVQESAHALLAVVNDILDLSKIEAGKITLENAPFNPVFLIQDCAKLMAPTAHQKNLHYELIIDQKMPDMVFGDVSRLRQIILNLIGNAVKFTTEGSVQVRAKVKDMNEAKATIEFSVKDTGIGISTENQRFLFMPFAQIDSSSTRKFGGTGLGLTISKRFVEIMDGKIGVDSKEAEGSIFWFIVTFDRHKLHDARDFSTDRMTKPSVEPVPAELAVGRRVLVVEDSAVLQHLALRQLSSLGIDSEATVSGLEAIEMALSGRFDLVLMDINLPDITGTEATAAIRKREAPGEPGIPIIAMTAGAMKGDRERALASGMNDYLAKPVAIENLKRMIELWFKKSPLAGVDSRLDRAS